MTRRRVSTVLAAAAAALLVSIAGAPAQAAPGDIVTISGTVTSDLGVPLAGQFVQAYAFPGGFASAVTDENGFYQLEYTIVNDADFVSVGAGLLGSCDLVGMVSGPGSYTANCVVTTFYHFTVSGTATTDDGSAPAPFSFVGAYDNTGTAFGSGEIQADGSYLVSVSFTAASGAIELFAPDGTVVGTIADYAEGDAFTGYDFTYHPPATWDPYPATISGTVTTKKGKPVEGAQVEFGAGGQFEERPSTTTAADGTFELSVETYWNEELLDGSEGFVFVDGVMVEFLEDITPDSVTTIDYRVGKSPVFEPWIDDIEYEAGGTMLVDVLRKIDRDGSADLAVCTDWGCAGADYGSRKTEYWGLTPSDNQVGSAYLLFRDTTSGQSEWLRVDPSVIIVDTATFGPKRLDGSAYFDVQGDGPTDFVVWADHDGVTSVYTWGSNDGTPDAEEVTVDGRFVSAEHRDLDGDGAEELVLVTRTGNRYAVTLVTEATGTPATVATGKGAPTVTYEDPDSDLVYDIVVTFPGRHGDES